MFYELYMFFFMLFFMIFGLGLGLIITLTFSGLIGGLIGLFIFNNKMITLPNKKIAAFLGYVALIVLFIVLPFFLVLLSTSSTISSSYRYGYSNPLTTILMFFSIPFIHCALTIGVFIFLENTKGFNNDYFQFALAYFLASMIIVPIVVIFGFLGFLGGFGSFSSLGSLSSIPSLF